MKRDLFYWEVPEQLKRVFPYLWGALLVALYLWVESGVDIPYSQGKGEREWYGQVFSFPIRIILPGALFYGWVTLMNWRWRLADSKLEGFLRGVGWAVVVLLSVQPNPMREVPPYESFSRGFMEKASAAFTAGQLQEWRKDLIAAGPKDLGGCGMCHRGKFPLSC